MLCGEEAWPSSSDAWLSSGAETALGKRGSTRWHIDGKSSDFKGQIWEGGEKLSSFLSSTRAARVSTEQRDCWTCHQSPLRTERGSMEDWA